MPYTGIVLTFIGIHAAAFLILLAHWVATTGMYPQAARAFADVYERRPIRATLLGIFTYGPLILLLLSSGKIGNAGVRLVVVMAALAAVLLALIGSAGLALRIGRNLCAEADPWRQSLRGGVMLALVLITPLLGSFFLLHVALASGFGTLLLARPWKAKAQANVPPLSAETPTPVPALP